MTRLVHARVLSTEHAVTRLVHARVLSTEHAVTRLVYKGTKDKSTKEKC